MRTRSRKRAVLVAIRGTLLVSLAVILEAGGYLTPLESLLYRERVRHCQGYQPQPAPSLVHLDVDDNTLNDVGHWPWPPATLARIVDEVARAQPKVLEMDVLFAEPAEGDDVLAASFKRLGSALIPVSLNFIDPPPDSRVRRSLLPLLVEDPERTEEECLKLLRPKGITAADLARTPTDSFSEVRQAAFRERIWRELTSAGSSASDGRALRREVRQRMLPRENPLMTTVLDRLFDEEFERQLRLWSVERFTLPPDTAGPTPVIVGSAEIAPVRELAGAAAFSGYVDYLPEETTVRTVPLLAKFGDRVLPHMDLVAACTVLGADVRQVRLTADTLVIPRPGAADVVVPVSPRDVPGGGRAGAMMELPLFGKPGDWLTMYDVPRHERPARHVSVDGIWQVCQTIDRLRSNSDNVDQLLKDWMARSAGQAAVDQYEAARPTGAAREVLIRSTLADTAEYVNNLSAVPDLDAGTRGELETVKRINVSLQLLVGETAAFEAQLARQRAALRDALHDRAVFFGGTATSLKDVQPTDLFGETPGIVVHGAVFNAIVTGKMWRRTPAALGTALTAAIGLVVLLLVMWLSPAPAFVASVAVGLGYLAVNGYVLFARDNLIVDAAGPAVAVAVVWALMTLADFLTEVADRARITKHFRTYVDPVVVDYVIEHPEHVRFDGERRELTIGFSDLAGFTTLTDQLGERVVPVLAEYVGQMIPVIRDRRGTFDKQIGDGLCFFFGAPKPDDQHAAQAVRTVMAMHAGLVEFNRTLDARGFPRLGMRIGLATGEVIVGDAGAKNAASYTTLGGTTNLASRLEGANKNFGTHTLVTARTVELLGDEFLLRPIANLRVAGKLSCTVVYEPICAAADATDRDRELAERTTAVFDAYRRGDFAACQRAVAAMEAAFGPSKLTRLYAERSAEPYDEKEHCDGQIVLTEK
jgi:class 3 adenylate cyclase/CHASE2 domain-containing sensor protein